MELEPCKNPHDTPTCDFCGVGMSQRHIDYILLKCYDYGMVVSQDGGRYHTPYVVGSLP